MQKRMRVLVAVLAGLMMGVSAAAHADSLTVKTAQGSVRGKEISNGKVTAYLGIPYAAAPVEDLRWRPPVATARWRGTRDATKYGARCMQRLQAGDMVFKDTGPSEDCLFVNVFAPADAQPGSKLPVMFWIHGGGYFAGAGSEPRQTGEVLPTRGVILVTFNYRLGVFGFLATPELAKEGNGAAGNYGLMDQVAALQWVKQNIADFGGDPANVTIFGESAGSWSVSTLMAAQSAQGLFARAIGESGGSLNVGGAKEASYLEVLDKDQDWVKSLGMDIAHLRMLPADEIQAAGSRRDGPRFSPVVDGRLLTEPIAVTYAAGRQAHVPLLAGWNRQEQFSISQGMTVEKWKAFATEHFPDKTADFLKVYPGDTDEQAVQSAIDYQSDNFIVAGTWQWIEAQVKTGDVPVYRYRLDLPPPSSKFHKGSYVFHSDDIEYVFGTLDTRPESVWTPADRKLSEEMMTYWTNFAKTGDPNGGSLPQWPRFDKTGQVLHLDSTITAAPADPKDRFEFTLENMRKRP
jgi:para-nitrobenzyl esterase